MVVMPVIPALRRLRKDDPGRLDYTVRPCPLHTHPPHKLVHELYIIQMWLTTQADNFFQSSWKLVPNYT
jgi:hypothetical protein